MRNTERKIGLSFRASQLREERLQREFSLYQDKRYLAPTTRCASVVCIDVDRDLLVNQALGGLTISFGPDDAFKPSREDFSLQNGHRSGPVVHADGKRIVGIDLGKVSWGDGDKLRGKAAVHSARVGNRNRRP